MSGVGTAATQLATRGGHLLAETPSDGQDFTAVTVSPGLPGFIVVFLIAVALVLLVLDMSRRVRRIQARERVEERHRLEEEELRAEQDAAGSSADSGDAVGTDGGDASGRDGASGRDDSGDQPRA